MEAQSLAFVDNRRSFSKLDVTQRQPVTNVGTDSVVGAIEVFIG